MTEGGEGGRGDDEKEDMNGKEIFRHKLVVPVVLGVLLPNDRSLSFVYG